jgi:hypothetical protein
LLRGKSLDGTSNGRGKLSVLRCPANIHSAALFAAAHP